MGDGISAQVGVLGPLVVSRHGELQKPGARRLRRLLTMLAAGAATDRWLGSDELLTVVYGTDVGAGTRRALSTEIWRCRQLLGGPESVLGDREGYRLNEERVDVDALRYIAFLEEGRSAMRKARTDDAEYLLTQAMNLWRGDPLVDLQDHPAGKALVARLSELRLGGEEDYAEVLVLSGRPHDAIGLLDAITRDHPFREHAWALLVECYAALDDRRRAQATLDTARRTLAEHGVGLGTELRSVRDLLRSGEGIAVTPTAVTRDEARGWHDLNSDARVLVEVAAAVGVSFDQRAVIAAAGYLAEPLSPTAAVEALASAVEADVLTRSASDPQRCEFTQVPIHDQIYEALAGPQRARIHAAIYQALSRTIGRDRPTAAVMAHHAAAGWPYCSVALVVAALEEAAAEASRHLVFEEAHGYYRQALDLVDMDYTATHALVLESLLAAAGQAALAGADLASARRTYRELADHGRQHQRVDWVLQGSIGLLQTYANERVDSQILDELADGLKLFLEVGVRADDADLVAEALAELTTYQPERARDLARRILDANIVDAEAVLRRVWEQESVPHQLEILKHLENRDLTSPSVQLRAWVGRFAAGQARPADAPPGWVAGAGNATERWEAHVWATTVAITMGDFARADRLLAAAEDLAKQASTPLDRASREAQIVGQLQWLAHLRADMNTLLSLLPRSPVSWSVRRPIQRVFAAFTASALLPPDEAWRLVDDIVDEFEQGAAPARHQLAPLIALATGCMAVRHERGMALCRELLSSHQGEHGVHYVVQYWGYADYHLARLAAAAGDLDEAIDLFEHSLEVYRSMGARCFEAWNLRTLATVRYWRNQGSDRIDATMLNDQSSALYTEIGMNVVATTWPPLAPLDILVDQPV